jgi:hypothetical protein
MFSTSIHFLYLLAIKTRIVMKTLSFYPSSFILHLVLTSQKVISGKSEVTPVILTHAFKLEFVYFVFLQNQTLIHLSQCTGLIYLLTIQWLKKRFKTFRLLCFNED